MLRSQPLLQKYYTATQLCAKPNIRRLPAENMQPIVVSFTQQWAGSGLDDVYSANQQFVATVIRVSVP